MLAERKLDEKVGLHIEVPVSVRRHVKERAAITGITIREWIEDAIDAKLSSDKKASTD